MPRPLRSGGWKLLYAAPPRLAEAGSGLRVLEAGALEVYGFGASGDWVEVACSVWGLRLSRAIVFCEMYTDVNRKFSRTKAPGPAACMEPRPYEHWLIACKNAAVPVLRYCTVAGTYTPSNKPETSQGN